MAPAFTRETAVFRHKKRGCQMPALRTKCISTKVTDEEYARLAALAGQQTISAWMRSVLLRASTPPPEPVLLAEILALRTIILNLHFKLCRGEPVTDEAMERVIEHADRNKLRQAGERLGAVEWRTS
jgi:hypothetical protein